MSDPSPHYPRRSNSICICIVIIIVILFLLIGITLFFSIFVSKTFSPHTDITKNPTSCQPCGTKRSSRDRKYYSQDGQDKYVVEHLFNNKQGGIFVDIGAHDGITYSNTYYLEKELGWTGICIEPQDETFKKLERNRKCLCLHGCISDTTGTKQFLKVNGPSEMLSGLLDFYDSRHYERVQKEVARNDGSLEIIPVQTFQLNDICSKHGITHIDFLSIDTEGSEDAIIQSINFDKIIIAVIAVENNFHSENIRSYLLSKGYKFDRQVSADDIYIKQI